MPSRRKWRDLPRLHRWNIFIFLQFAFNIYRCTTIYCYCCFYKCSCISVHLSCVETNKQVPLPGREDSVSDGWSRKKKEYFWERAAKGRERAWDVQTGSDTSDIIKRTMQFHLKWHIRHYQTNYAVSPQVIHQTLSNELCSFTSSDTSDIIKLTMQFHLKWYIRHYQTNYAFSPQVIHQILSN